MGLQGSRRFRCPTASARIPARSGANVPRDHSPVGVATGKALLACQDLQVLDSLPNPLPRPTSKTIDSLENLKAELARVRACGYATNFEEWREGVHGLGAAIFDESGMAIAAVGLSAPANRMGDKRTKELGQSVLETAEKITRALGGRVRQGST